MPCSLPAHWKTEGMLMRQRCESPAVLALSSACGRFRPHRVRQSSETRWRHLGRRPRTAWLTRTCEVCGFSVREDGDSTSRGQVD